MTRTQTYNSWETLSFSTKAEEKGFVSASIRGTSTEPAKFDDFSIQLKSLYSAKLYQENHYYPFGMNMKGLESSDKQTQQNKAAHEFQFNAQTEREESFGLFWDETPFRNYDSQLGRLWGVDKMAEIAPSLTPFRFGFNNPILYNDPSGLWEKTATGWKTDDVDEMKVFFQAWNRAGSEREIIDAEEGDEDNELFRIVGTGEVGVIHGKEKSHPNAKFRINSKKSKGETQKILHNNPVLGDLFKAGTEFENGNYVRGGLYFGSQVASMASFSRGTARNIVARNFAGGLFETSTQLATNIAAYQSGVLTHQHQIITELDVADMTASTFIRPLFFSARLQGAVDFKPLTLITADLSSEEKILNAILGTTYVVLVNKTSSEANIDAGSVILSGGFSKLEPRLFPNLIIDTSFKVLGSSYKSQLSD